MSIPSDKTARICYAYLALAAEGALLSARWVVHSPARLAVAAVVALLMWMWA